MPIQEKQPIKEPMVNDEDEESPFGTMDQDDAVADDVASTASTSNAVISSNTNQSDGKCRSKREIKHESLQSMEHNSQQECDGQMHENGTKEQDWNWKRTKEQDWKRTEEDEDQVKGDEWRSSCHTL